MKTAVDVVNALAATSKRLEKEQIIKDAWTAGIVDFFHGAKLCYDPFTTFGVAEKMVPAKTLDTVEKLRTTKFQDFVDLTNDLSSRKLTGNEAREAINLFMMCSGKDDWNLFYRPVLLKDLRTGCSESTINKVLEKIGSKDAAQYIVKLFECQLAKDSADVEMDSAKTLETKLDGVRFVTVCDVIKQEVIHYTRNGNVNTNFPHITKEFKKLLPHLKVSMMFDGEVVGATFQEVMKQINRKGDVDLKGKKLALFDCMPLSDFEKGICEIPQAQRTENLTQFTRFLDENVVFVLSSETVDLHTPTGKQKFKEFNEAAIKAGFEGIMIKDPTAPYECKRSKHWLKLKPFIEESLDIYGIEEGTGKYAGKLGNLLCRGKIDGKSVEVSVGSGFSDEDRAEIWSARSTMIGMIVEVRADCLTLNEKSDTVWSMRFPRFKGFRGSKAGEKI